MLNKLGILFATLFVFAGLLLLHGPISGPDTTQTARLLGGAALVTFGSLTILLVFRDWLHWRKHYRNAHRHLDGDLTRNMSGPNG